MCVNAVGVSEHSFSLFPNRKLSEFSLTNAFFLKRAALFLLIADARLLGKDTTCTLETLDARVQ